MSDSPSFAQLVTTWQRQHGRNHLPWQNTRNPYHVWLSEIMLQQTQVSTVLGYYSRFLSHFPTVQALAEASEDAVMAQWSGLGYYSRARNLHRCAQTVMREHGGQFPPTAQQLETLPGIGRSTANAIASFCYSERVAILDANVRRVLSRVLAFEDDLAKAKNVQNLWDAATDLLPTEELHTAMPQYTQGMMDLGAQLCSPRKPQCLICPVARVCKAHKGGNPTHYPVQTRKLKRSAQAWWLLLIQKEDGAIWLQKRPNKGIWAGLYAPPIFADEAQLRTQLQALGLTQTPTFLPSFSHVLTHLDLQLYPVVVACTAPQASRLGQTERIGSTPAADPEETALPSLWQALNAQALAATGLPAPLRALLPSLSPAH